jgi:RNA polymerase sigma factor (sigma-70 family)
MEDHEVVAAIVAGDLVGLGEAYDRYALPLYAYCRSMLREPADAADVVQDTFVTAVDKLTGLRDPDKLRAWLYAVARNECLRRLRTKHVTSGLEQVADLPVEAADIGDAAEQAELRQLVRDAIDGLNQSERDVIELSLGHNLDGDDLAATLGVPRNQANALLSRARRQLERSLGALIVARTGRRACPVLETMLTGWDGQMTVLMRKRVSRHIEQCTICGELKRRELHPALLGVGVPLVALLPGFREQVLGICTGKTAAALAHRASVLSHAGRFGPAGFPRSPHVPGVPGWHLAARHSHVVAAGAATSVAAGAAIAVLVTGIGPPGSQASSGPKHPAGSSSSSASAGRSSGGIELAPSVSGMASISPGTGVTSTGSPGSASAIATTATAGASSTTGGASAPAAPSSAVPSPSPAAASSSASPGNGGGEGTLTMSTSTVTLTSGAGSFTITATGGPIQHFNITVRSAHYLTVSPSSGSLAAGASMTITVTSSQSTVNTWIIVNPGGNQVAVTSS